MKEEIIKLDSKFFGTKSKYLNSATRVKIFGTTAKCIAYLLGNQTQIRGMLAITRKSDHNLLYSRFLPKRI